jgi:hypothetical protein
VRDPAWAKNSYRLSRTDRQAQKITIVFSECINPCLLPACRK